MFMLLYIRRGGALESSRSELATVFRFLVLYTFRFYTFSLLRSVFTEGGEPPHEIKINYTLIIIKHFANIFSLTLSSNVEELHFISFIHRLA